MGLDISRVYTDCGLHIIGQHKNALLTDEVSDKVSNPDIDTDSKTDLDTTQCANYLLNDPLNLSINTPSYNFEFEDYDTTTILPRDMKQSQPGRILRK